MKSSENLSGYAVLGILLITVGILFTVFSYLILHSTPFMALGILCLILGLTNALVPETLIPTNTVRAMIEAACINVEALLEEYNAEEKAIYLPPSNDGVYCLVPLKKTPPNEIVEQLTDAPLKLVSKVGGTRSLIIYPLGSEGVRLSHLTEDVSVDDALNEVLVRFLEYVESIKFVQSGNVLLVEMKGSKIETRFPRYRKILGSIPTSVAGCVFAQILKKPVSFIDEQSSGKEVVARFEALSIG